MIFKLFNAFIAFIIIVLSETNGNYDYLSGNNRGYNNLYRTTPRYNNYDIRFNNLPNSYGLQKFQLPQGEKVKIQVYYECLCPDCRKFDSHHLIDAVRLLGPYLDIYTYPYGNARTYENNGLIEFECQHGPKECYGNKLHACVIDMLQNSTLSVLFNGCLMDQSQEGLGSDDRAVDVCSRSMGIPINPEAIKQCARSVRGTLLLKMYGEESKKANFNAVPYILINGVPNDGEHFMRDVCRAFNNPPPACAPFVY